MMKSSGIRNGATESSMHMERTMQGGVAILLKKNIKLKIQGCEGDGEGRILRLDVQIEDQKITLINIYAPNEDCPKFFQKISDIIELAVGQGNEIILGGDFNLWLSKHLDKHGTAINTHPKATVQVQNIIKKYQLLDIWRFYHKNENKYTRRRLNPDLVASRLDYFLITSTLKDRIKNSQIISGYNSDHDIPIIIYDRKKQKQGPGFWKFNNSLLSNILSGSKEDYQR